MFATKWEMQACHLWCQCGGGGIIIIVVVTAPKRTPITCSVLSLTDVFIRTVSRWGTEMRLREGLTVFSLEGTEPLLVQSRASGVNNASW